MRAVVILALLLACGYPVHAQGVLDRRISLRVRRQPLERVLDTVAARGGFTFSYNSTILPGDSLTTYSGSGTVRQVLEGLLGNRFQFIPRDGYVIIVRAPPPVTTYTVTGVVIDQATGLPLASASVYDPEHLQSTLTDERGFFRLRVRDPDGLSLLRVSKEWYEDTSFVTSGDQESRVVLRPVPVTEIAPVVIKSPIEHSWWGRLFLSSRQRVQSLNLPHFFKTKPYQVSLLPSIGTQGRMGAQVTNRISLNLIGGYSAGTDGVEIAGAFNLDRKDVRHAQAAGLLNIAGGSVRGVQVAGIANIDMDSAAGATIAGNANVLYGSLDGAQLAGAVNICRGTVHGVQVSGLYNHVHLLKGVQIGVINIADSSEGYSIGLISIVHHGMHQVSVSYEEGWTAAYKSGNPMLYSIVLAGYAPGSANVARGAELAHGSAGPTLGYGFGHVFPLGGRWSITAEVTAQQVFDTHWNYEGDLYRVSPSLAFRLSHAVSIFAGPRGTHYAPAGVGRRDDIDPFGVGAGLVFF